MAGCIVSARARFVRVAGTSALGVVAFALGASNAAAATPRLELCVPKKAAAALVTPRHGVCGKGYKLTRLAAEGPAGPEGGQGAEGKAGSEGKAAAGAHPGP